MTEWRWVKESVVHAIHGEQVAEHGGREGMHRCGASVFISDRASEPFKLWRTKRLDLAAAYAYGIIRNHPFIDGNKRTGFLAAYVLSDGLF